MLDRQKNTETDVAALMARIGREARAASRPLATAAGDVKDAALRAMADAIEARETAILEANALDMDNGADAGLSDALMDRLKLTPERIRAMADGIRAIAALKDPVGDVIAEWDRPNGLHIERVRTPLGVIGVIYESRPNVTADAGALCLKAGNAVILRGGSDSLNSSSAIHGCLAEGLEAAGLPAEAIQMVPVTDRAAVGEMLTGLGGNLDVIIPRGGRSLVERVQTEARVPVSVPSADVFCTKPLSISSDHRKICIGSTLAGSVKPEGGVATKARMPIISSGAVSPSARAMPMMVPVRMPGRASGRTWWNTVWTGLAPTASAASRIEGGTALIALRPEITITGMVISASVMPPTSEDERGRCSVLMNTARPRSPKMIEGTAARLLIETSTQSIHQVRGANSSR